MEMASPTDAELLLASGRGDREAFALLVQRHHRAVIQFVHRFLATADRATAEDLAQQVFLGAWKYAPTFQPRAKVLTWLFRIATNTCLNYRRYEQARPSPVPLLGQPRRPQQDQRTEGAELGLLEEERTQAVRAAVAALPPRQRVVIVLRYFDGFSYAEIATIMETSASAVDALLHRARRALHERLGGQKRQDLPQIPPLPRAQSL
jgi:RNA polymerase sigma-70 factor (ECF subfamily)